MNSTMRLTAMLTALLLAPPVWAKCDPSQPNQRPTDQYVLKDGTVYDKKTNLTWQRCSVGQKWAKEGGCSGTIAAMNLAEAAKQASGGWRLPTKDELVTLVSLTCKNPAINDDVFPGLATDKPIYWTSTENGTGGAWVVIFDGGHAGSDYRSSSYAVRLVRSGQ